MSGVNSNFSADWSWLTNQLSSSEERIKKLDNYNKASDAQFNEFDSEFERFATKRSNNNFVMQELHKSRS